MADFVLEAADSSPKSTLAATATLLHALDVGLPTRTIKCCYKCPDGAT
jgi:hypothetical protein